MSEFVEKPTTWQPVQPMELRIHNKFTEERWFWQSPYKEVLEQKWERVHCGQIIDTEWRPLLYEDDDLSAYAY